MRAALAITLVLSGTACAQTGMRTGQLNVDRPGSSPQECSIREVSRDRLTVLGGRPAYVDADAFVTDGKGSTLLAGTLNLIWKISPEGEINGVTSDSIFGVVIAPDGTAEPVPAPMDPRLIEGIRAAPRPGGGWDVVFVEVFPSPPTPDSLPPETKRAAHVWYGWYDGADWSELERLPVPDSALPYPAFTSSLVRHGDTLSWAAVPHRPNGSISFLQRVEGRWTHEKLAFGYIADVDLAYWDTAGLILAAVQPDLTPGGSDGNSLLLWAKRPGWQRLRRLVHGSVEGPVNHPSLVRAGRDFLATWWTYADEGLELRARYVRPDATEPPAFVVDSSVDMWSEAVPVITDQGVAVWAVHHPVAAAEGSRAAEVRYVAAAGEPVSELARAPSPYFMRMAAVQPRSGDLLVTGMQYVESRFMFSLLLRNRVQCRATP